MAEQQSILAKFPVDGSISFKSDDGAVVVHPLPALPPPDKIILRDESGQPWAITVAPDGQLQTAKWLDGEPFQIRQDGSSSLIPALDQSPSSAYRT